MGQIKLNHAPDCYLLTGGAPVEPFCSCGVQKALDKIKRLAAKNKKLKEAFAGCSKYKNLYEVTNGRCEDRLIEELRVDGFLLPEHYDPLPEIENPGWEEIVGPDPHNWRKYVPACVKKSWDKLPMEARIIIYAICDDEAGNENWD